MTPKHGAQVGVGVEVKAHGSPAFTGEQLAQLQEWTTRYPHKQMGLIEAMRLVQGWQRHISLDAVRVLARMFGVPPKLVYEVATFYPYFTSKPCGKNRIAVCHNLSCTLAGAEKVLKDYEAKLGIKEGETTADGEYSLEAVECLGACDMAPAVAVNDELEAPKPAFVYKPAGEDKRLLTRHFNGTEPETLEAYRKRGGYQALDKALTMKPGDITEEVKKSNLRGLGGAGFPVGLKWSTLPPKDKVNKPHYLVANADESEPGCFKDRVLMERSPHQLLEGLLIAARAIDADALFIFIRGEYARQFRILTAALSEARSAGLLHRDILLMRGAGAYISGADTALLETMEGKKAWPRQPPPFPTAVGVMGNPTCVNNVETLMMVPHVIAMGGEAFAALGAGKSGGTVVLSVSGHVRQPGVYEVPMGTPMKAVLDAAGACPDRPLKAVIPGGTSTPVITAKETEVKLDFDSVRAVGSFLGAGGLIALDDSTDMARVLHIIERFLWHESCGQCTPCREGSGWLTRILERMRSGGGVKGDLENIQRVSENVLGKVICALGDTVGMVPQGYLKKFPEDFAKKVTNDA